ncbi:MAG: helix-turn-helix domain-containing protein [Chloroflexi bacterium]|nr:helix-turn-helix domain-containing protein [Chloroflexota bacterium]
MVKNYASPEKSESAIAKRAALALTLKREARAPVAYFISNSMQEEPIELPAAAVVILRDVLEYMSHGHGITLFPRLAEVTTMEAADILNVSRPYVIKLLEAGEIPYRMVGRHRRIPLNELISYKSRIVSDREAILDQMVAEAEELGLYD